MSKLNIGVAGQTLRINLSEDVSSNTALSFTMQPRYGNSIEKTDLTGVSVGTSNVNEGDSTYIANEYLEYVIEPTDLTYAGEWRIKGTATLSATNKVISDYKPVQVLE